MNINELRSELRAEIDRLRSEVLARDPQLAGLCAALAGLDRVDDDATAPPMPSRGTNSMAAALEYMAPPPPPPPPPAEQPRQLRLPEAKPRRVHVRAWRGLMPRAYVIQALIYISERDPGAVFTYLEVLRQALEDNPTIPGNFLTPRRVQQSLASVKAAGAIVALDRVYCPRSSRFVVSYGVESRQRLEQIMPPPQHAYLRSQEALERRKLNRALGM